jgi:hypothetical protein
MIRRVAKKVKSTLAAVGQKSMSTSQINPPYKGERKSPDEMYRLFPVTPALTVPEHIIRPPYALEAAKGSSNHPP